MSWLAQGLTNSVTGKISQISGQLKEILTESTEDIVDPNAEMRVMSDKMREMEKRIETLNMECTRWQEMSNELNLKCQTFEALSEQRQAEFRQQLLLKESQIVELRNQLNSNASKMESMSPGYHQKSSLMEEFEEIMPSSELNDYIQLQKEIKRLKDDNVHLGSENKELLNRVRLLEASTPSLLSENTESSQEPVIESLKQEIQSLKHKIDSDNDKHQGEIVAIQQQYKDKLKQQSRDFEEEMAGVRSKLAQVEGELEKIRSEDATATATAATSSSKSDDGWCLNGEEIKISDLEGKNVEAALVEKDKEIEQLKLQVEAFESDLEQANNLILKLKSSSPQKSPPRQDDESRLKDQLAELTGQFESMRETNASLEREIDELKRSTQSVIQQKESVIDELNSLVDGLRLEIKQQQQSIQQEKMLQLQEVKQEQSELDQLKKENAELKSKLDEKLGEIKLLGDQINDLNLNLNTLKSNDSSLFAELQAKTEQFLSQLDKANTEIATIKFERDQLDEQYKQLEASFEHKTKEASQLKSEVENQSKHISAQTQAIEKLQEDLKQGQPDPASDELTTLKAQYNELYSYLEKKNEESLKYYNEIQRLNGVLSDQNAELNSLKSMNDNLSEQYENLSRGFQLEQKMVEDLNQQIFELNKSLLDTSNAFRQQTPERSPEIVSKPVTVSIDTQTEEQEETKNLDAEFIRQLEEKHQRLEGDQKCLVEKLEQRIEALQRDKSELVDENRRMAAEMATRLEQTQSYYENLFKQENENVRGVLANEEQQKQKMSRELARLKEHLMEMSENYNKEAIQAEEREKQLRTALTEAQAALQQQGANLETSSKEMEIRVEQLVQQNQELLSSKEKLNEKLKQTEEGLNHQIKVTKNLELVLERLQSDKDSQHSLELVKFQQTIKDQAKTIHNLQTEAQSQQAKIEEMRVFMEKCDRLEMQLMRKDDLIKTLNDQMATKDALIESYDKRANEAQKITESFIEKEMIKNLIIGYIKVHQPQEKKQVLKLISTMLNFTPLEIEQCESSAPDSKWFGLMKTSPNKPSPSKSSESGSSTFAELLIQYVDRESKPKANLKFDINDPMLAKKTDSPSQPSILLSDQALDLTNSESAVKFFNNSLQLVNRSSQPQQQSNSANVANSILEQILK